MDEHARVGEGMSKREARRLLIADYSKARAARPDPDLIGRVGRPTYRFTGYTSADEALAATALDGPGLHRLGRAFVGLAQEARTFDETAKREREAAAKAESANARGKQNRKPDRDQAPADGKRRGFWNRSRPRKSVDDRSADERFQEQLEARTREKVWEAVVARNLVPQPRVFTGRAADDRAGYVADHHEWQASQEHLRADLDDITATALEAMVDHYSRGRVVPGTAHLADAARQLRAAGVEQRIHAMHSETRLRLAGWHAVAEEFASTAGAAYEDFSRDAIPNAAASIKLRWRDDVSITGEALDEIVGIVQSQWASRARGFEREAEGYRNQLARHDEAFPPGVFTRLAADRKAFAGVILEDLTQGRTAPQEPDVFADRVRLLEERSTTLLNLDAASRQPGAGVEPDGNAIEPTGAASEWSVDGRDVNRIVSEADTAIAGIDTSLAREEQRQATSRSSTPDEGAPKSGEAAAPLGKGPPVARPDRPVTAVGFVPASGPAGDRHPGDHPKPTPEAATPDVARSPEHGPHPGAAPHAGQAPKPDTPRRTPGEGSAPRATDPARATPPPSPRRDRESGRDPPPNPSRPAPGSPGSHHTFRLNHSDPIGKAPRPAAFPATSCAPFQESVMTKRRKPAGPRSRRPTDARRRRRLGRSCPPRRPTAPRPG
ncbi:hypothetical protein [Embleya sp. MST-111070]|uniref:hypothetical protein n=1 Tax=Embleya sp. MST-111070 TaxID=3398231 RepID=UPI003F73B668